MVVKGVTQIDLPSCLGDPAQGFAADGAEVSLPCFVAGPENRLATVAIERLLAGNTPRVDGTSRADGLDAAAQFFNPLVLTGPTGSGKSHLARGIARHYHQLLGAGAVEYFAAIDFARQLRAARDEGELELFRDRLGNLSFLIIENLQRLPQRSFVQRELCDTIDSLVSSRRKVLLTAQQSPATMMELEASLRDRLGSGLTVQLRPPGIEARREILELAAASRPPATELGSDQLANLAKNVEGPVPQLFRALAELDLTTPDGPDLANLRRPIQLKQLIAVVARYYSITQAALLSSTRRKSLVHARSVVIHLARKLTDLSYAQIGHGLGRRDHTTIMHAHRNIKRLLADDPATQQAIDQLQRILTAV